MQDENAANPAGEVTPTSQEVQQGAQDVKPEESSTPETPAEKPEVKSDDKYLKRINKLTWQRSEARREAEALRRRLEELEAKSSQPAKTEEAEPKESDYQSYAEYLRAVARYETNQRLMAERKASEEKALKQTRDQYESQIAQEFQDRISEFREQTEDFDDIVQGSGIFDLPDSPTVKAMSLAIAESDIGPQILYHLAQNIKEANRLTRLSPYAAAREIGKLEATLSNPKPKKPSKAPDPITPIGGKSGVDSNLPKDSDDVETWMKKERARMRSKKL